MLLNHLKIALRILLREKLFSGINIIGLSAGLSIALLIILFVRFELSYENYNPNADQVFRISMDYLNGDAVVDQDAETYPPLGPLLKEEYPQVLDFVRATSATDVTLNYGDKYFNVANVYGTDASFFSIFQYPFIKGDQEGVFQAPFEIVLTESMASTIFGDRNAIGASLSFASLENPFKVVGIIKDPVESTHLKFDLLISFPTVEFMGEDPNTWNSNNFYTYLLMEKNSSVDQFNLELEQLSNRLHKEEKIENERVIAQPMKDIHLYSHKSYEAEVNGSAQSTFILLGVAGLVILIALLNYINLSTAKSLDRAKEVGIRKVIGSSTSQLKFQFIAEAFLVYFLSLTIAVLAMSLFWNGFLQLADLPETFQFINEGYFWMILICILLGATFLTGAFPALMLSGLKPIKILKGNISHSNFGIYLRKSLVILQFAITTFLLIQTLTVREQIKYMRAIDLGFDIEHRIVVKAADTKEYKQNFARYKEQLLQQPQFQSVALSTGVPGSQTSDLSSTTGINLANAIEDSYYNFYINFIDSDFIPTMSMDLLAGRNYDREQNNELKIIVNEESIRLWEIPSAEEAIGQMVDMWGENREIIGVVRNFHQLGPKSAFIPMIFIHGENWQDLLSIRTGAGNLDLNLALIKNIYEENFPDSPFEYFFLDQEYEKQYKADQRFQVVFRLLTGFAMVIACLGLFGLVSFTVNKRSKEIGIRKVLGASITNLIALLSREFVLLILIAIVVVIPITYYLIQNWLLQYANRISIMAWLFVLPIILLLGISLLTVLVKTIRLSTSNPTETLKEE